MFIMLFSILFCSFLSFKKESKECFIKWGLNVEKKNWIDYKVTTLKLASLAKTYPAPDSDTYSPSYTRLRTDYDRYWFDLEAWPYIGWMILLFE